MHKARLCFGRFVSWRLCALADGRKEVGTSDVEIGGQSGESFLFSL